MLSFYCNPGSDPLRTVKGLGLQPAQQARFVWFHKQKSRIRETKHLSTDADSSTYTTVRWTKNTQKPNFFFYGKNHPKCKNSKTSRYMPKLAIRPSTRGL